MADWGLYSALRYQDDWATRRQDKMIEMQVLEKMQGIAEKDLQQQQQMEAGLVDYMDKIKQMNILAKDQEKLNQLYREEMKTIVKGISNVNGDLRKYMMSGGITQLNNFKNSIINSELAKQAQVNKLNYDAAIKAMQEGKHLAPSIVRYRGDDGEIQEGLATWQQQMALFEQNRIDQLSFAGATDPIKVDPKLFFDNVKDPNNPYYAHDVTWDDFYKAATAMGAPDWYAHELATDYIKSGQTWKWKAFDPLDAQVKRSRAAANWARAARDRQETQKANPLVTVATGHGMIIPSDAQVNIGGRAAEKRIGVSPIERYTSMNAIGLSTDSNGNLDTRVVDGQKVYNGQGVGATLVTENGIEFYVEDFNPTSVNSNEYFYFKGDDGQIYPHVRMKGTAFNAGDNLGNLSASELQEGGATFTGADWYDVSGWGSELGLISAGISQDNINFENVYVRIPIPSNLSGGGTTAEADYMHTMNAPGTGGPSGPIIRQENIRNVDNYLYDQ